MMRSMFSGVSGLRVHQTRMDVIGNNIANVNTVGYKSQRVTFSDVFSQTISSATGASDATGRGGINAMQVGLGVGVSSIDMLMTQGAAQRTDNPFDVMVDGDGFMVVGDANGRYYTRAGALRLDDAGNLVIPNGMKVQGWLATDNGSGEYTINAQEVQPINLFSPQFKAASPTATTKAEIAGNLCATDEKKQFSVGVYDSLGNYYTIPLTATKKTSAGAGDEATTTWTISVTEAETEAETIDGKKTKKFMSDAKGNKVAIDSTQDITQDITFDSNGKLTALTKTGTNGGEDKFAFDIPLNNITGVGGSSFDNVSVDISGLTQYATDSTAEGKAMNGNSAGTLSGYSIDKNGVITGTYTNGEKRTMAQVVLAQFDNPAGLEKVGDNLYAATNNSGEFDGIGEAGSFSTGVLEMSNVDLSSEFTDMIVTQRGFQANSRIITVSDEMLQELTNLKR